MLQIGDVMKHHERDETENDERAQKAALSSNDAAICEPRVAMASVTERSAALGSHPTRASTSNI